MLTAGKERLQREGRAELHIDSPHAHGDLRGYFQKPQPHRSQRGSLQRAARQAPRTQPLQQQVGKGT